MRLLVTNIPLTKEGNHMSLEPYEGKYFDMPNIFHLQKNVINVLVSLQPYHHKTLAIFFPQIYLGDWSVWTCVFNKVLSA